MAEKPSISNVSTPPSWLTRAEKAAFRRIIAARKAMNKPVSEAESDMIADLVTLRSRIADTRSQYEHVRAALARNPDWKSDQAHLLATSRMIDAQTAKAQQMAAALGLFPTLQT